MKVLLTGGAGYIGTHIALALIKSGIEPIIVDNFSTSSESNVRTLEAITGERILAKKGEIGRNLLSQSMRGIRLDAVIHLAAYKDVQESTDTPLSYYHNNLNALMETVDFASMFGTHTLPIIFSSSAAVYGNRIGMVKEGDPLNAMSPYAHSKVMCEQILKDCSEVYGIQASTLRYFNPIGMNKEMQRGMVFNSSPNVIDRMKSSKERFTIYGSDYPTEDGTPVRDFISVEDVAEAHASVLRYMLANRWTGVKTYNVGTGQPTSILQAARLFEKVNACDLNICFGERRAGDIAYSCADVRRIKEDTGWAPKVTLEEMLKI